MASIKFPSNWNSRRRKVRRGSLKSQDVVFSRPVIRYVEPNYPVLTSRAQQEDDLFRNLRFFLILGKCLGLVHFQGLWQKDYKKLRTSKFSAVISFIIMAGLLVNLAVGLIFIKRAISERADQYAEKFGMFLFNLLGIWVYLHFYRKGLQLIQLIHKWNDLRLYFTKTDIHLFRDVNLVALVVMISAIGENLFVNLKYVPLGKEGEELLQKLNRSLLEHYFIRANGQWADLVPYHHALNLFTFISIKLSLYAWNYTDITITLIARALYFKFQALYAQGEDILFHKGAEQLKWSQFIRDFETLRKMLREVNKFLSPLIFITYGIGIFFMCMQFHNRLNPYENTTPIAAIYALWSILHLIARILLVSISGARINDWAHKISDLLRRCPNKAYMTEIERTENFISCKVIGLTGLGCFTITKPLILDVIAVIFTFEMVLLQALQSSLNKSM